MSGGSFDFLYYKEISELIENASDLHNMSDELAELGYATDAAKETQQVLMEIRRFKNRMAVSLEALSPLWKAMEWWRSSDSNEDSFKRALNIYRKNADEE